MSAKFMPFFQDRGCHVVSATDPYGRNLAFLDRSRYCLFQVAPQLSSRDWMDPVPDPLLLRKCGNAGNRTRTSVSVARNWPTDHRRGLFHVLIELNIKQCMTCALRNSFFGFHTLYHIIAISTALNWFWRQTITCTTAILAEMGLECKRKREEGRKLLQEVCTFVFLCWLQCIKCRNSVTSLFFFFLPAFKSFQQFMTCLFT
jgi:hypothetical protein